MRNRTIPILAALALAAAGPAAAQSTAQPAATTPGTGPVAAPAVPAAAAEPAPLLAPAPAPVPSVAQPAAPSSAAAPQPGGPPGVNPGPGTIRTTAYLRAGPGEQYKVLDELDPQEHVTVQSCDGTWCKVLSEGAPGYIRAYVLTAPDVHAKPPPPAPGAPCFTAQTNGNPRTGDVVRVCDDKVPAP